MDRSVFYQTIIERFNLTQVAIDILDQELYEESLNKGECNQQIKLPIFS